MATIEDLTSYVDKYPFHYVERWRLAKKLFKAKNYEKALVHLEVLDNDWEPKDNLTRYLAATYMRLDRLEDAIQTLKFGVKKWPDNLPLLEQLAMMQNKAGRIEEALISLELIFKKDQGYRLPENAKLQLEEKRLTNFRRRSASFKKVALPNGMTCVRCGAQNTDEVTQCWQCKHTIAIVVDSDDEAGNQPIEEKIPTPKPSTQFSFKAKYIIVLMLIIGTMFTYGALEQTTERNNGNTISTSFHEWIVVDMINTRMIVGAILLVLCPFLLQAAYRVLDIQHLKRETIFKQAMLFSTTAYALSWIPGIGLWGWGFLLLTASFILLTIEFKKDWSSIATIFAMFWVLITVTLLATFTALHGFDLVKQLNKIAHYAQKEKQRSSVIVRSTTPVTHQFTVNSTGSSWLDNEMSGVEIHIQTKDTLPPDGYQFILKGDDDSVIYYESIHSKNRMWYTDKLVPNVTYSLTVTSDPSAPLTLHIKILGLMPITVNNNPDP